MAFDKAVCGHFGAPRISCPDGLGRGGIDGAVREKPSRCRPSPAPSLAQFRSLSSFRACASSSVVRPHPSRARTRRIATSSLKRTVQMVDAGVISHLSSSIRDGLHSARRGRAPLSSLRQVQANTGNDCGEAAAGLQEGAADPVPPPDGGGGRVAHPGRPAQPGRFDLDA